MSGASARIFLLSPADCSGKRAQLLQRDGADFDLARALRSSAGARIGDVFAFMSSLYFRGKLAYARAFARPPHGVGGIHVITPADGLRPPESPLRVADIRRYAATPVDAGEERYRAPLARDLEALVPRLDGTEVVLLGSVASPKYTDLLTLALGARLLFPVDFVGRGDMSRGGLLLRCVSERRELGYVPVLGATVRGARPPRLPSINARRRARPQGTP
ncbi:MAG: hypothetical protein U0166_11650 [Acidobacteriota bacterium]